MRNQDDNERVDDPPTEPFAPDVAVEVGYNMDEDEDDAATANKFYRCRCHRLDGSHGPCPIILKGVVVNCTCCKGCRQACALDA